MTARNLLTALAAALQINPVPVTTPAAAPKSKEPPGPDILLNALRNSATGRDQIMQRRIGLPSDDPTP